MNSEHKQTPSNHETHPSSEMREYRDRVRDEAERFLTNPALEELLVVSEAEGRISAEELEELLALKTDPDVKHTYLDTTAALVAKAMNWRARGKERHTLRDDDLSPEYRDAIKRVGEQLGMNQEVPIPAGHVEVAAVLGATVGPVAERTDHLYDRMEQGDVTATYLVGLGAERPMMPPDLKNAGKYPYVGQSTVETHLLSFAAQDWFTRHGYDTPSVERSSVSTSLKRDANYDSKYRIETVSFEDDQRRPEWAPDVVINISAPYGHTTHSRVHTGETIEFMQKLADLKEGDKVLFISHQPYLLGQKFEIDRLCQERGIQAVVAGYESRNPNLPATVWGGEISKAAKKAAQLHGALRAEEEPTLPAAA